MAAPPLRKTQGWGSLGYKARVKKWASLTPLLRLGRLILRHCSQRANAHILAGVRGMGDAERKVRINRPTQYAAQAEQGLTSAARTVAVQALADDLAIGTQNGFSKSNQIRVAPGLISHVGTPRSRVDPIDLSELGQFGCQSSTNGTGLFQQSWLTPRYEVCLYVENPCTWPRRVEGAFPALHWVKSESSE
jgi:hypothetical protein